jgi:hypothetical protein
MNRRSTEVLHRTSWGQRSRQPKTQWRGCFGDPAMTLQDNFASRAILVNHDKATESTLHEKSITWDREDPFRRPQGSAIFIVPSRGWFSALCIDPGPSLRPVCCREGMTAPGAQRSDLIRLRGTPNDRRDPSGERFGAEERHSLTDPRLGAAERIELRLSPRRDWLAHDQRESITSNALARAHPEPPNSVGLGLENPAAGVAGASDCSCGAAWLLLCRRRILAYNTLARRTARLVECSQGG